MPTAAILGASGYAGQETLDRLLAHPELELLSLGSDSLAGRAASALDVRLNGHLPAFVPNDAALQAGADVVFACLGNEEAAALEAPDDTVVVDLSGAHRLGDAGLYAEWYGFEHPHADSLAEWSYAVPELAPPTGRADREPGVLRDGDAARARSGRRPARAVERRRRRQVRRVGRRARAEGVVARGLRARERLAVPRRDAPARARDRAGARLPRVLRPAPAAGAARADRHVLRDSRRRTRCARGSRRRTPARASCTCSPRASRRSSRACRRRTPRSSACSRTARPARRS